MVGPGQLPTTRQARSKLSPVAPVPVDLKIAGLLRNLRKQNDELRRSAASELVYLGKPALPGLIQATGDRSGKVRAWAIWALGEFRDRSLTPYFIAALADRSHDLVSERAAVALQKLGPDVLPELIRNWHNEPQHWSFHHKVIDVAVAFGAAAIPHITAALEDKQLDAGRKRQLIEASVKIGDPRASKALYALIVQPEGEHGEWLAQVATQALRQIDSNGDMARVIEILNEALMVVVSIAHDGVYEDDISYEIVDELLNIAEAFTKVGENRQAVIALEHALHVTHTMDDALIIPGRIAAGLAESGQIDRALQLVQSDENTSSKLWGLTGAIRTLSRQAGQRSRAIRVSDETIAMARSIEDKDGISFHFREIAGALADLGEIGRAMDVVRSIDDDYGTTLALREIGYSAFRQGKQAEAIQLFHRALSIARSMEAGEEKAGSLGDIAEKLTMAGERLTAEEVIEEAIVASAAIEEERPRQWAFQWVSLSLARMGQLDRALDIAQQMNDDGHKAWALLRIERELGDAEERARALALLDQLTILIPSIKYASSRARVLAAIAIDLGREGETARGLRLWDDALEMARSCSDPTTKASALTGIASELGETVSADS